MAGKLDAMTPAPARLWLLTQLVRIGREESVLAVAGVIDDKDDVVRDARSGQFSRRPPRRAFLAAGALAPAALGLRAAAAEPPSAKPASVILLWL
jgi:hypothetical protein